VSSSLRASGPARRRTPSARSASFPAFITMLRARPDAVTAFERPEDHTVQHVRLVGTRLGPVRRTHRSRRRVVSIVPGAM
jgi:hypothetical protein